MSRIDNIQIEEFQEGPFISLYGVVYSDSGRWKYIFELNGRTWVHEEDYLDNVRSDFINETSSSRGIESTELFWKMVTVNLKEDRPGYKAGNAVWVYDVDLQEFLEEGIAELV